MSRRLVEDGIAALLTKMSTVPYWETAACTIRGASDRSLRSAVTMSASPPSDSIMFRVSLARSSNLSTSTTRAPSRANSTAMARPVPRPGPLDPAPVTIRDLALKLSRRFHRIPSHVGPRLRSHHTMCSCAC